jgi:hypothetical protein
VCIGAAWRPEGARTMTVDPMFWLATAAVAWGLSLASYRWFAVHNGWPMGEWQAHRPGLPIAIGALAVGAGLVFAVARGGETAVVLPLLGLLGAFGWTALTRVGAQSALLLAPLAVIALMVAWISAASHVAMTAGQHRAPSAAGSWTSEREKNGPAATDREGRVNERDRGITFEQPRPLPPITR